MSLLCLWSIKHVVVLMHLPFAVGWLVGAPPPSLPAPPTTTMFGYGRCGKFQRLVLRQHCPSRRQRQQCQQLSASDDAESIDDSSKADQAIYDQQLSTSDDSESSDDSIKADRPIYDLGIGKHKPIGSDETGGMDNIFNIAANWLAPEPVHKPSARNVSSINNFNDFNKAIAKKFTKTRRMVARDNEAQQLRAALWDEMHFSNPSPSPAASVSYKNRYITVPPPKSSDNQQQYSSGFQAPPYPTAFYPDIDLSIPDSVYSEDGSVDLVWDLLRWEAFQQAQREPLLVSFLHSTILNHASLESSLAFLLANRLQSTGMISTQLQSLILDSLENSPTFRRSLRADMMAVRDRDPACNYLPDVFLYFKGFHALQTYRVAHYLWTSKNVMAKFLQSQVSQIFQIDIHPNAVLGSGIMLDHGTGIVIGETATVGHNCSILHHVTLGGSGKTGVKRHPSVGDGVLLGAGATVLGPVTIGQGTQIGAGTLVISDLPPHSVAVGVPARIIGSFIDVTKQPSIGMDHMISPNSIITFESEGI